MPDNYVGVFMDSRDRTSVFVYVGDKKHFPSLDKCEFLQRINLGKMNLQELHDDATKENVLFGGLCCYPTWDMPSKSWEAINMGTSVRSVEEVIKSTREYFSKFIPKETLVEKVEIEREGGLRRELGPYAPNWVAHEALTGALHDRDIAKAAIKAGYKVGEDFKYKITIEPKKRREITMRSPIRVKKIG